MGTERLKGVDFISVYGIVAKIKGGKEKKILSRSLVLENQGI